MLNRRNNRIPTPFENSNQELHMLEARRSVLQHYQTRLHLLAQFQQKGVTRSDYIGFQPRIRR